jgi:KaiC/GvpD/RAD55 family RecA-like ATPase
MNDTPASYLHSKGIQFKIRAGQMIMDCQFCGEVGHFYMEQKDGQYFCHKCGEKGNLKTFMRHLGDQPMVQKREYVKAEVKGFAEKKTYASVPEKRVTETHNLLLNTPEVLSYVLETRKLSLDIVKAYKLGLSIDAHGNKWLTIPHYENGKLVNVKSRSLPPAEKTFRRIENCKSVLFNGDTISKHKSHIIIAEGCIDGLTLLTHGIQNVVAVTNGAGSFDVEWIDKLKDVERITLCYDADEAGQKGAKEVARRLGYGRCFNLNLPRGMDLNDYFQKGHEVYKDFHERLQSARRYDVEGISSLTDCIDRMEAEHNSIQTSGLMTNIYSMDRINHRGMRAGELWIVAAPPGIGKSSLALQIIKNQAYSGTPSLFFSLEMNIPAVTERIIQSDIRREIITQADIQRIRTQYANIPMYVGRATCKPTLDGMIDVLRESTMRYGLKILAFDHLHFLCRSISNQVQEIGLAVQAFKLLAEEMEIPIILIAQPRKCDLSRPMTAEDLKDSSSIHSDADGIIILHRKRIASNGDSSVVSSQSLDPITLVRYEKARFGRGGECLLHFYGAYSLFSELTADELR